MRGVLDQIPGIVTKPRLCPGVTALFTNWPDRKPSWDSTASVRGYFGTTTFQRGGGTEVTRAVFAPEVGTRTCAVLGCTQCLWRLGVVIVRQRSVLVLGRLHELGLWLF